jgi:sugar/nucleoside kinase (ribokinase family)
MEGGDILEKERISVIGAAAVCDYIYEVSKLPEPGDIVEITREYPDPVWGGCAPNIAVGIKNLTQITPELFYPVGFDYKDSGLEDYWKKKGLNCENVSKVDNCRSGYAHMYMQRDGKTICLGYPGAARYGKTDTEAKLGEWVVIAPVLNGYTEEYLKRGIEEKKSCIVTGICSLELLPYLPSLQALIINQHEADYLMKHLEFDREEELAVYLDGGLLFITNGEKGSKVYEKGRMTQVPVVTGKQIVDFTGAGDAYTSGVVSAMAVWGLEPVLAGYVGAANASFALEMTGGQTNLPCFEQLIERLEQTYPGTAQKIKSKRG